MCICVNMYVSCYVGATKGQKRALDPLELELEMVINLYVGAG